MRHRLFQTATVFTLVTALVWGQQPPAPTAAQAQPAPPPAQQPAPPPAQTTPAQPAPAGTMDIGGFRLQNISLVELVDILARRLKINYILDPRVKGAVTINTYGEVKPTDLWQLLETILRINSAAIVKVGDLYRIVPLADVARLPVTPQVSAHKELTDDEHRGEWLRARERDEAVAQYRRLKQRQCEERDERSRQPNDRSRIATLECAVAEKLREDGEAHHADRKQNGSENAERENPAVGPKILE